MSLLALYETVGGSLMPAGALRKRGNAPLGRIVIDSRQVESGDVFFGLQGPNHRGSDYAEEAFARGAIGAVLDRPLEPPSDRWVICPGDTQAALAKWAAYRRRRFTGTLIAVTGSVGKSTTRQMIHTVLGRRFRGIASPRNFNNHVGLPLSLLEIQHDHDYAVMELGASRPGEIASLAQLCRPKIGVITPLGLAHLAGFGSRQAIARAKAELLAALPPDGCAVLANDAALRGAIHPGGPALTWAGTGGDCDLVAQDIRHTTEAIEFRVQDCPFHVPVCGQHHVIAALLAIGVGRVFGMDFSAIADALAAFQPLPMRCEILELRGATVINDSYNANPTAMRAALELLRDFDPPGRRIVVCGDMAELGDESGGLHWQLGSEIVTVAGAELLVACGEYCRHVVGGARTAGLPASRAIACNTVEEALPRLGQAILPGDVVLVKGSRMMRMERVVEALDQYPRRRSA